MDIQHKTGDNKGSFFIEEDGEVKAELTYSKADDTKIIIDHTEVSDELQGENIGKTLIEHAVNYARDSELKVIPVCSFAKSVIESNKSLQDVLN